MVKAPRHLELIGDLMSQPPALFLEDLSVGQTFGTGTVTVEKDRLKAFAAEFDPQPFHLDETAAGSSLFGGLVASGWHTAAMTMRLMVESDFRLEGGLIGVGVEQVRWPHPVHAGDVLRVECEVIETRPSRSNPDRGLVRFKSKTLNQKGDVVMEQTAILVVPRDPRRANGPGDPGP
jgi:acyl dehydratase